MGQKKEFILKNVGNLYLKYGIRSVTMDDVANELGISKKTLYQYFTDKENMVNKVMDYFMENPAFNLNSPALGNPVERIFALRKHLIEIHRHFNNNIEFDLKKLYPELYKKVYEFKRKRIYQSTIMNIEEGQKEGLFREGIDPEFIARLQVGRMLYTLNPDSGIFSREEVASAELFDKTMDYHLHAICTEKGLECYKNQLIKVQNEKQN